MRFSSPSSPHNPAYSWHSLYYHSLYHKSQWSGSTTLHSRSICCWRDGHSGSLLSCCRLAWHIFSSFICIHWSFRASIGRLTLCSLCRFIAAIFLVLWFCWCWGGWRSNEVGGLGGWLRGKCPHSFLGINEIAWLLRSWIYSRWYWTS